MKVKQFFSELHYKSKYSCFETLLVTFLQVLSAIYYLIISLRIYLYDKNIIKPYKSKAKVISIGNLTTGGTGKTPIVASIISYLDKNTDYICSILTRGYGRQNNNAEKPIIIIKDNNNDPKVYGDEPVLLSNISSKCKVYVSSNRVKSAKIAEKESNILILDDGYQHLRLDRNLNILLIDADKKFGNNSLLPLGPLRESVESLKRADIFIFTIKSNKATEDKDFIDRYLLKFNKPILFAKYEFSCFVDLKAKIEYRNINYTKVAAFCGIGQPDHFFKQLLDLNLDLKDTFIFEDHHSYTFHDLVKIVEKSKNNSIEAIITTEKDAVKLDKFIDNIDLPIYSLKMQMNLDVEKILELGGLL